MPPVPEFFFPKEKHIRLPLRTSVHFPPTTRCIRPPANLAIPLCLRHDTKPPTAVSNHPKIDTPSVTESWVSFRTATPHLLPVTPCLPHKALEMYIKAAQEDGDEGRGYRTGLMALKCLNNAVWDQPAGQASFLRLGGLSMLVGLLQVHLIPCLGPCDKFLRFRRALFTASAHLNANEILLEACLCFGACCPRRLSKPASKERMVMLSTNHRVCGPSSSPQVFLLFRF